ncbi:sigma-70 family RNA polymerase sigma factor [Halosquirtibacter xylanolyticus]|uniref:RNA polymerase sigma factor n=1 Tax=Halosquirtibacter xylanolyticus TaxID=3374599 RepID=UPI003748A598|nr:sigma-70 family RNA polymerase sigma factor [Prolixibacteraceae bacterium]
MTTKEYNELVKCHSDGAYRYALRLVKDGDTAHDLIQDCFEKIWIRCKQIDVEKSKSYLFMTIHNGAMDLFRRSKFVDDKADVTLVDKRFDTNQYSDLQEQLHEALESLPEIQRSVVLLRDYEGYSYDEIAEITNLNESQVKVYIFRARKSLRKYIGSIENLVD